MKKDRFNSYLFCLAFTYVISLTNVCKAQCIARDIIKDCKTNFVLPYKYSGCWMSQFTVNDKTQKIEGHFVALEGLKYQIVFCASESAENVIINIYDRGNEPAFMRHLVVTTKGNKGTLYKMQPERSGDYYIEYIIPPIESGKPRTACMILLFGSIIDKEEATTTLKPNKLD